MSISYRIRPLEKTDRNWVADFLDKHWGSTKIVSRGQIYYGHLSEGFVAEDSVTDQKIGLITYRIEHNEAEILSLDSLNPNNGVGMALLDAVKTALSEQKVKKLWLITTNDNIRALRWWQKRGFALKGFFPNAIAESRKLKPQIPLIGLEGIPIRDEILLELSI